MSWFRITDGCLRFGGRVTKGPVREWLDTADGSMATDRYLSVVTAGRISGAVQRRPELDGWVEALISTGAAPTSN